MNARKGDHEERAEDAPAGRHSYSGSIKRVDEVNSLKAGIAFELQFLFLIIKRLEAGKSFRVQSLFLSRWREASQ